MVQRYSEKAITPPNKKGRNKSKKRAQTVVRWQRDLGKLSSHTEGSVEFCEATPTGLADESKESLYGRETDRDLRNADLLRST